MSRTDCGFYAAKFIPANVNIRNWPVGMDIVDAQATGFFAARAGILQQHRHKYNAL